MALPKELEEAFRHEVEQYREEKRMPYISSLERDGMEKVTLQMLRRLLQRRFKSVPKAVQTRLSLCSVQQLEELVDVALAVDSLDEFVNHLPVSDSTSYQLSVIRMRHSCWQRE